MKKIPMSWLLLALAIVIADQLSKYLAVSSLATGSKIILTPFLNFTLAYNRGASFSFLADAGGWQRWFFLVIAIAAIVYIAYLLSINHQRRLFASGLVLILGGAIGNAIDRVYIGAVVDFIQVHWQNNWFFPVFNLADSAITCGAVLAACYMLKNPDA